MLKCNGHLQWWKAKIDDFLQNLNFKLNLHTREKYMTINTYNLYFICY
jgi:hypothetical protein